MMELDPTELGVLYGIFLSFGVAGVLATVVGLVRQYQVWRLYKNTPRAEEVRDSQDLCPNHHEWNEIYLAITELDRGKYKVCSRCGFIAGTRHRVNDLGLEALKRSIRIKKEEDRYQQSLIEKKNQLVREHKKVYLQQNLENFRSAALSEEKKLLEDLMSDLFDFATKKQDEAYETVINESVWRKGDGDG
jgi:hypothetical protein